MVRRITDRNAVERAMDEFDEIGRHAFLKKHGFGPARRFFVLPDEKKYNSKAIYGAAHKNEFTEDGDVLPRDFTGGEHFVKLRLEALGFSF